MNNNKNKLSELYNNLLNNNQPSLNRIINDELPEYNNPEYENLLCYYKEVYKNKPLSEITSSLNNIPKYIYVFKGDYTNLHTQELLKFENLKHTNNKSYSVSKIYDFHYLIQTFIVLINNVNINLSESGSRFLIVPDYAKGIYFSNELDITFDHNVNSQEPISYKYDMMMFGMEQTTFKNGLFNTYGIKSTITLSKDKKLLNAVINYDNYGNHQKLFTIEIETINSKPYIKKVSTKNKDNKSIIYQNE